MITKARLGISLALVLAAFILAFVGVRPAFAQVADPDVIEILNVRAFRNLAETGDFLVVIHYNLDYDATAEPTEQSDETFICRLMDVGEASELGHSVPFPFANDGYSEGVCSVYFAAADAPAWGQAYVAKIEGNPLVGFAGSPPEATDTLGSGEYSPKTAQVDAQLDLTDFITLTLVESLEADEDQSASVFDDLTDNTDEGLQLSIEGASYFERAIPNLENLAPQIVPARQEINQPPTPAIANSYEQTLENRWTGTFVDDAAVQFSSDFGISEGLFWGGLTMIAYLGVVIFASTQLKDSPDKTIAVMVLSLPILMAGVLFGMPLTVFMVLVLIAIMIDAFALFLVRA